MRDRFLYVGHGRMERKGGLWPHLAVLLFLLGLTAFVNSGVEILGLYQDDLYVWDVYSSHRPLDYIFLTGTSRFRPVWNLISCVMFKAVGAHTQWLVPIHLAVNGAIAWLVYYVSFRLGGSRFVGCLMGAAYALSHFAYYQVSMVLGMMEAFALAFSVGLLYLLIRYLDRPARAGMYGYGAVGCYLLAVFTHERYMVLILLILAVFGARRDWKRILASLAGFGAVQLIRLWAIGTISPPGTGDTTVAETFRLSKALGYAVSQVLYLFGINAGPEHLNGIPWEATQQRVKLLVGASIALLALLVLLAAFALVYLEGRRAAILGRLAVLAGFIALCIGCSSVTVRVEMRWVYVSYAAALCTLAYLYGVTAEGFGHPGKASLLAAGLAAAYVTLLVPVEGYYRSGWSRMYYHNGQQEMNSLAEETWFRYGDALFDKTVYVLGNNFEIADYTWETVFSVFHPQNLRGVPEVRVVGGLGPAGPENPKEQQQGTAGREDFTVREDAGSREDFTVREDAASREDSAARESAAVHEDTAARLPVADRFGLVDDSMVILAEDKENHTYINITDYVRDEKLSPITGYYRDGWTDENCRFRVRTGSTGKLQMNGYYPGRLEGGEATRVTVRGLTLPMEEDLELEVAWSQPTAAWEMELEPYQTYEVSMESNFYVKDAKERRGVDHLAFLLGMAAD